jgi:hypothetical protein
VRLHSESVYKKEVGAASLVGSVAILLLWGKRGGELIAAMPFVFLGLFIVLQFLSGFFPSGARLDLGPSRETNPPPDLKDVLRNSTRK